MKYFIHTFEISKLLEYNDYQKLHDLERCNEKNEYKCKIYSEDGIKIYFRKCTDNERMNKKKAYGKLWLVINPARLIEKGTYVNVILNKFIFEEALYILDDKIGEIFKPLNIDIECLDDFKLSRVDITKDIKDIPENVIHAYATLLRRMRFNYGYRLNTQLENNCQEFNKEDSINIINDSQGFEFVIYNKHKASIDQQYSAEAQEYYKDTLRMELRCGRKYINKKLKDFTVFESLMCIYEEMDIIVKKIFEEIFKDSCYSCFVSYSHMKRIIDGRINNKKAKKAKMLSIARRMYENPDKTLPNILEESKMSISAQNNNISYFDMIAISPIPIKSTDITYLPPINSLLEFEKLTRIAQKYYDYFCNAPKSKLVFVHEPD